jgi:hypothetical protein
MHAGRSAVRRIDDFALDGDPDMRVCLRDASYGERGENDEATNICGHIECDHGVSIDHITKHGAIVTLYTGRAPVGTRVVAAFQGAVGMQNNCAGVTHGIGIGLGDDIYFMAGRHQVVGQIFVKSRFHT